MSETNQSVLIVEDEENLAKILSDYFVAGGYHTVVRHDGESGLLAAREHRPDVVLLDLMLPKLDGVSVCKEIRKHSEVPIIMVTAKVEEIDRLLGFDVGADDYISKPFSPKEVVARVKAVLRRAQRVAKHWEDDEKDQLLRLDEIAQRVTCQGEAVVLTPTEYKLCRVFLLHPGQLFSRARLLDTAYDLDADVSDRVVDSHIKNLRKKLDQHLPGRELIQSVYGVGYRFEP